MNKSLDIFCEIPCLTERSPLLNAFILKKKWFKSADPRAIVQILQKFIDYNSSGFSFLGVQPFIIGSDKNTGLQFRTSAFIGTIPLRASDTGKQIGDFVVIPRFIGRDRYEDYIEILDVLGAEISPYVIDSLPLASGRNFRPPLYLEAIKFITSLEILLKTAWRKFDNVEKYSKEPTGNINWEKYIRREFKVENRFDYPKRNNILSEFHKEYSQIRFVFDICKNELLSSNTPLKIKKSISTRLSYLDDKLYMHKPESTYSILNKASDSKSVALCKEIANKILKFNLVDSTSWKVDFAEVFEKYIQYIFKLAAKETGGKVFTNYKFHYGQQKSFFWQLNHLEPDIIYRKADLIVYIDAKYKSNLFNKNDTSEFLKEEHRHDLHQILAYTSFSKSENKYGILCYPSNKIEIKKIPYRNMINETISNLIILGIPLKREFLNEAKRRLIYELNIIEKFN